MALWEAIKSAAHGEFNDAVGYLFVPQSEVDRGRALDSQLETMVKDDYAKGIITDDQLAITMGRIQANSFAPNGIFDQPGTDVAAGLQEGALDGLNNVQKTVKQSIAGTVNFGAGLIPWQGWVILGLYVAWRVGWLNKLKF